MTMTLSLPRQPSSVTRARHVLTTLLSLTDVGEEARDHLAVMMSEACANAVLHADSGSTVDVTILIDGHDCLIEVGNRGDTPDDTQLAAELPDPLTVGGRGLPLIGALADTAAFLDADPGHVLLRLTKYLSTVAAPSTS
ncbi:ATP-binding protein [Verrucosispora sp. NA02020]|nr:ATP-binding protein [Verrucosispora sp. NA02020]